MNNFINGIHYLLTGLKLVWHPTLRRFITIPFLINTVIFILLILAELHGLKLFAHWLDQYLPSWLTWLSDVINLFLLLSSLFIMLFIFSWVANLLAMSFNGLLAEKVTEKILSEKTKSAENLRGFIQEIPRMIKRMLKVLGYYLPRLILFLILFVIPVINVVAGLLLFFFNAWILTINYVDYPADNQKIDFLSMRQVLRKNFMMALGFGSAALVMTLIPVINFIVMPAAVIGATMMWHEKIK